MGYPDRGQFLELCRCRRTARTRYRGGIASPSRFRRLSGQDDLAEFQGHQLPGQHLAERQADCEGDEVAGAWRTYEFNVTDVAKSGAENVLAIQVMRADRNGSRPSLLSTGTRRRPTRTWVCGARSTCRRAARWRCVIRRWCRTSTRPPTRSLMVDGAAQERQRAAGQGHAEGHHRRDRVLSRTWIWRPSENKDVMFDTGQFRS